MEKPITTHRDTRTSRSDQVRKGSQSIGDRISRGMTRLPSKSL